MKRTKSNVKSFRITEWNRKKLDAYCKQENTTATEILNDLIDIYVPGDDPELEYEELMEDLRLITEHRHLDLRGRL
jgi:hypothetical protein